MKDNLSLREINEEIERICLEGIDVDDESDEETEDSFVNALNALTLQ